MGNKNFLNYYTNHGEVITGGSYFNDEDIMATGGETGNNDDFANSEKSRKFVPSKPTKDEICNIISGTRAVTNGTTIQAASSYLRGSEGASHESGSSNLSTRKDEERLREYISENNLWLPLPNPVNEIAKGGEAIVYFYDGHIIKINSARFYDSWKDYFNSLLIHNYLFPATSYELIGFSESNDSENG